MQDTIILTRPKTIAIYEHERDIIDEQTGEILRSTKETVNKVSSEPDFIKVYYKHMLAFADVEGLPVSFVMSLSRFLQWANDNEPMYVVLDKRTKESMCTDCGVKIAQLNRYIAKAVETGLIFRTKYRATYEANPWLIAKGEWSNIRKLQTSFDYIEGQGRWARKVEV